MSVINPTVSPDCPFCFQRETVYLRVYCYSRKHKVKCQLLNVTLARAKMSIDISWKIKLGLDDVDVVCILKDMLKICIEID